MQDIFSVFGNLLFTPQNIFSYFAKTLIVEAVLKSTHNLYFGQKIRKKKCIPLYYVRVCFKEVNILRICYPDVFTVIK